MRQKRMDHVDVLPIDSVIKQTFAFAVSVGKDAFASVKGQETLEVGCRSGEGMEKVEEVTL